MLACICRQQTPGTLCVLKYKTNHVTVIKKRNVAPPVCFCLHVGLQVIAAHPLFLARVPAAGGGSLKPGAFQVCQPGPTELRKESDSPLEGVRTPSPDSPVRSSCQPNSPAESKTCNLQPANLVVRFQTFVTASSCASACDRCLCSLLRTRPKLHPTPRPATGRNTSTLSSTLCVLLPR